MTLPVRAAVLLAAALLPITGNSIRDLIALPDGRTVFFRARTGIATESSWRLDQGADGVIAISRAASPLVDTDAFGAVQAVFSLKPEKVCGYGSSTCFQAANCNASFGIWTAGAWQGKGDYRQTLVRLNQRGTVAWIEQKTSCIGMGVPSLDRAPLLRGFYDTATLKPLSGSLVPTADVQLANSRTGRQTIVDSRGALTIQDGRLQWWRFNDESALLVFNHFEAVEAVADATGCNVVYVDRARMLRWMDCRNPASDEELRTHGEAPAISADGRHLAYINDDGELEVYDRFVRSSATGLIAGKVESFAVGGANTLFASTSVTGLLRMQLDSGAVTDLLPVLPEITSTSAVPWTRCETPFCYGPFEPTLIVSRGMRLRIESRTVPMTGWRMTVGESVSPLGLEDWAAAPFQFPYETGETGVAVFTNPTVAPGFELRLNFRRDAAHYARCMATVHSGDLSRAVTAEDPARVGERIRVYVTGLVGVQAVGYGVANPNDGVIAVANPPPLADPGAAEVLAFVLSPGLVGMQQLDLRVIRPFEGAAGLFGERSWYCPAPVVQ